MPRGIPNVTEVKKPEVAIEARKAPLVRVEMIPSNWDIVPAEEGEDKYLFTNIVTNRVITGTISEFNELINPKE